jgi:ribosomal protein L11 methyltransferase
VKDYILELSFDSSDHQLEEILQSRLFLTPSSGSSSSEINGTTVISAYFDDADSRDAAQRELADVEGVAIGSVDRDRVDWLERYEQSLEPLFIGERFVVAPDAALIPDHTTRHALLVPQEQAFGTGSHETTSLCIEILETLEVTAKRALDIGAGSGILALAMCRLGAQQVIAFDNDLDAFAALRENRRRNGIDDARMPIFIGGLDAFRGGLFDIIAMNIIPEVIVPLLGEVTRHVSGSVILSGILIVKRDDVVRACAAHGLALAEERARGEWWAGRFTLRPL